MGVPDLGTIEDSRWQNLVPCNDYQGVNPGHVYEETKTGNLQIRTVNLVGKLMERERIMSQKYLLVLVVTCWLTPAHAAILTVGPGGTHATIQAAVDGALVAPGTDEIRIRTGTFTENLDITPAGRGNNLTISGGWNAPFDTRDGSPSIVDGDANGRVVNISLGTGDQLVFENLKFQNGNSSLGAGMLIVQDGGSVLRISDCEVINNIAEADRAESGGLKVSVNEGSTFSLFDSRIADNQSVCTGTVDCREAGMGLQADGGSLVVISRNQFNDNSVTMTEGSAFSGGASLSATDSTYLVMEDNQFVGNSVTGTANTIVGIGLALSGNGIKEARRNRVEANIANTPTPANMSQMSVFAYGDQTTTVSDTVVVDSDTKGVFVSTSGDDSPNIYITNLTVAGHASTGIQMAKNAVGGVLNLANTISVDNGTNTSLGAGVTSANNLVTGSGGFVDAVGGDYSLLGSSAAVDAGSNSPTGGLGFTDISGKPRISGGTVDLGAYEFQSDTTFLDGFEPVFQPEGE